MPSLTAAPEGPDTLPPLSRRAASIISFSLETRSCDSSRRPFGSARKGLPRKPTLIDGEILRVAHDDRSLDDILQLTNISRPGVRLQECQTFLVNAADALSCFLRKTVDEVRNQHRNVFLTFPQRRNLDRKNIEPVKKVAPKCSGGDCCLEVAIGGGNHSNIGPDGTCSSDTLKLALLQNSQQSDLGLGGELADFIEEDRASFG